jgi:arylsulfatase A-like enzyme
MSPYAFRALTGFLLLCTVSRLQLSGAAEPSIDRPNIVFFLVDDMGWQDTSVAFHSQQTDLNLRYRTPAMERLAAEGMKFTQAYACSVCSPTRVSLMTGFNAARHRVTNWTLKKNATNDRPHPQLEFPSWNVNGIGPSVGTERTIHAECLPALLRSVGYRTIHVGKAHFGAANTPGADPRNIGFDVNIAGHAAGGPGSFLGTQNFSAAWRKGDRIWDVPHLEKYHGTDIFLTDALTQEAIRETQLALDREQPFFLYLSHYAVHVPFAEDKRFLQRYLDAGLDRTEAMYASMVEGMDDSLGRILAFLDRQGRLENTLIVFMSDNGGLSASGRGGRRHTHNRPLSSGKGSAHEGGIRVPMIVSWRGRVDFAAESAQPVIIEDLFPTLLEAAGLSSTQIAATGTDGMSIMDLLNGKPEKDRSARPLIWHFPNHWGPTGPGIGPSSSIRMGAWKLIWYHANQSFELFNLDKDLAERTNLASTESDHVRRLASELGRRLRSMGAQMPTVRETGKAVPWPDRLSAAFQEQE